MKRVMAMLMVLVMLLAAGAAAETDWYAARSLEVAASLRQLALDEEYVAVYTYVEELRNMALVIGRSLMMRPVAAYKLRVDDYQILLNSLDSDGAVDLSQLSDVARDQIEKGAYRMFLTSLNTAYGVTVVAATSILAVSDQFICDGEGSACLVLLKYPADYSVGLCFSDSFNHVIGVSAMPVHTDIIDRMLSDEAAAELQALGVTVEPLSLE